MDLTLFNLTCDVTWRRGSKALWVGKFWVLLRTLKLLIPFGYDQGFKLLVYLIIGDELDEIWCTCYRSRSAVMVASWLLFIQILTVCWKTMWTFLKIILAWSRGYIILKKYKCVLGSSSGKWNWVYLGALLFTNFVCSPSAGKEVAWPSKVTWYMCYI